MLRIIEGGRSNALAPADTGAHAVLREAARRIREGGYDEAAVRAFMHGEAIPVAQHYRRLQIEYAADALIRLQPIPADFRLDRYWPD